MCICKCVCFVRSLRVCVRRLILRSNRQSVSQPEHDLESETTRQGTKCVTRAQSSSLFLKSLCVCVCMVERERERERRDKTDGMVGKEEGYYQTYWTHQLIKLFEIATEGTRMPSSQGKRLMSPCLAAGELKKKSKEWNKRRRAGRSMCACVLCGAAGEKKKKG